MTIPVIRDLTIFLIDSALSACLICIGSNDHRKENLLLARQNLYALFPSIYFATEMETEPLYLKNTARFSNQVALFVTAMEKEAVVNALKEIEMQFCQILRLCAVLMTKADKKVVIFFHNMISVRFLPNGKR